MGFTKGFIKFVTLKAINLDLMASMVIIKVLVAL